MFQNHLKIAWRNLRKSPTFSFINILGLAMGMACSLLIVLWVLDEVNTDGFHANDDRLFSVFRRDFHDGTVGGGYATAGLLAEELKSQIPEIERATGLAWASYNTFEFGDKIVRFDCNAAGVDFFNMFSFPLLEGTPDAALNDPNSLAISRNMAEALFGSPQLAIGKTIRYENREDLMVSAVFENMPAKSSIQFDCLRSWSAFVKDNGWLKQFDNNGPATYLQLRPGADWAQVDGKIKNFLDKYIKYENIDWRSELALQPFNEKYLHGKITNGQIDGGRIEYVHLFGIIAVFILLIACVNFMNLSTARSTERAKEVGVRKVVGAMRSSLINQFMGEALLLSFLATIVAFIMVEISLPAFNELTGKEIHLPLDKPVFWAYLTGLLLVTGAIAGSYPALFLSSLQPLKVLKGVIKFNPKTTRLRQGLVVFQFTLSITLMICVGVIYRQIDFILHSNMGYERTNLVYLPLGQEMFKNYETLRHRISALPSIKAVTCISQYPTNINNSNLSVTWPGKNPNSAIEFAQVGVGYDFVKTMKLELLQGRDFSKDFPTDTSGYLINETALKAIGYENPIGQPISMWEHPGKIIGVLKDFHFRSVHENIQPLVVRLGYNETQATVLLKIEPSQTKEALASLEAIWSALNPKIPFDVTFAEEHYNNLYRSEQVIGKLSNYFALLAIFISCLGLFGLAAFAARQRTKEIGVRKVLGASVASVVGLLSKEFVSLVILSLVIASPLAYYFMDKWLQDFAYRIDIQWMVFVLAGVVAVGVAFMTVSFQSIKAALANPVKSLRNE